MARLEEVNDVGNARRTGGPFSRLVADVRTRGVQARSWLVVRYCPCEKCAYKRIIKAVNKAAGNKG